MFELQPYTFNILIFVFIFLGVLLAYEGIQQLIFRQESQSEARNKAMSASLMVVFCAPRGALVEGAEGEPQGEKARHADVAREVVLADEGSERCHRRYGEHPEEPVPEHDAAHEAVDGHHKARGDQDQRSAKKGLPVAKRGLCVVLSRKRTYACGLGPARRRGKSRKYGKTTR